MFTELPHVFPEMAELTLTPALSLCIGLSAEHCGISLECVEKFSEELVFFNLLDAGLGGSSYSLQKNLATTAEIA